MLYQSSDSLEILFPQRQKDVILENIRILVYKEDPKLFELLDFDNDRIFAEPLLFAYFNAKEKSSTLEQLLLGYIEKEKRPESIEAIIDDDGFIYLPQIGWLKSALRNQKVNLNKKYESICGLYILNGSSEISFTFEPIQKIGGTSFELINYQHPLLRPHYFDSKQRLIAVEIEMISKRQRENLAKALNLIETVTPSYYGLLEKAIRKFVIFNDPLVRRNSFATMAVHGCAFFNSFQPEYDEIFFVEDIAHQGGHVIFNNEIHLKNDFFRISGETIVKSDGFFGWILNQSEKRNLFIVFHALFTYYSIIICLQACISKTTILSTLQKHEALGRLTFCFQKFGIDLKLLGKVDNQGNSTYFSEEGFSLYKLMKDFHEETRINWGSEMKKINLMNQVYNFSNRNFHRANPLSI
jgi:hypothetical protein